MACTLCSSVQNLALLVVVCCVKRKLEFTTHNSSTEYWVAIR